MHPPYLRQIKSAGDLISSEAANRAALSQFLLEKNRRFGSVMGEVRALKALARTARDPEDLLQMRDIESTLLLAAGIPDSVQVALEPLAREMAVRVFVNQGLRPAGDEFIEELVYRFLVNREDVDAATLQETADTVVSSRITQEILATLAIHARTCFWCTDDIGVWLNCTHDKVGIEHLVRGLHWSNSRGERTLLYNLKVPIVGNNVDLCLFQGAPTELAAGGYRAPESYVALGELKGGIDPAGADEHWKTARTALDRIRNNFGKRGATPATFFVGAAIEQKMAQEIWNELQAGTLTHAANLNDAGQLAALAGWLCAL